MIYYVSRQDYDRTVRGLIHHVPGFLPFIRTLSYERLFSSGKAPAGNYIFTDFDRLTAYEIESASVITDALRKVYPEVLILNDPRYAMERYTLLKTLRREGINRFNVTRLDGGALPENYPVFIRSEDGAFGPDSGLCNSAEELERAISALREKGKVLKRRIAVEFCAQPDEAGYYRKYSVYNINGRIVPQHMYISRNWVVKSGSTEINDSTMAEEREYIRTNPHHDELLRIFRIARIDFGRIDYGIVDGTLQVYEINTNPHYPLLHDLEPVELKHRLEIRSNVVSAFQALDASSPSGRSVQFITPGRRKLSLRKPRFWRNPAWIDKAGRRFWQNKLYKSIKAMEKKLRN
jgi:hypothetical protein